MIHENGCTFYDRKIIPLNISYSTRLCITHIFWEKVCQHILEQINGNKCTYRIQEVVKCYLLVILTLFL